MYAGNEEAKTQEDAARGVDGAGVYVEYLIKDVNRGGLEEQHRQDEGEGEEGTLAATELRQ
jgi:hypothetical protein